MSRKNESFICDVCNSQGAVYYSKSYDLFMRNICDMTHTYICNMSCCMWWRSNDSFICHISSESFICNICDMTHTCICDMSSFFTCDEGRMTPSYVTCLTNDSFLCHICDMTHTCICDMSSFFTCDEGRMTPSYVTYLMSLSYVTWLIHTFVTCVLSLHVMNDSRVRDMSRILWAFHMWHDSYIHLWHELLTRDEWLKNPSYVTIFMRLRMSLVRDMSRILWVFHMWHDSYIHVTIFMRLRMSLRCRYSLRTGYPTPIGCIIFIYIIFRKRAL